MVDIGYLVRSLPLRQVPLRQQLAVAFACVVAATGARFLLDPVLEDGPFITFFPALLAASVWGGLRSGAMTLAMGTVTAAYFWIEPVRTLAVTKLGAATLMVFLVAGGIILLCAYLLHAAAAIARESEERADLIAREMRHRVGNDLALVEAIMRLSARNATDVAELSRRFGARLRVLAESHAATRRDADLPPGLTELLRTVLRPFDEQRIALSGPDAVIDRRDRPMLALLIHELGTNAVKHGALSVPEGRVAVSWTQTARTIRLDWTEAGGPPVRRPSRTGFGTQLARAAFAPRRGSVTVEHHPAGLRCSVTLAAVGPGTDTAPSLHGSLVTSSSGAAG